jgi:hypothetical protein
MVMAPAGTLWQPTAAERVQRLELGGIPALSDSKSSQSGRLEQPDALPPVPEDVDVDEDVDELVVDVPAPLVTLLLDDEDPVVAVAPPLPPVPLAGLEVPHPANRQTAAPRPTSTESAGPKWAR